MSNSNKLSQNQATPDRHAKIPSTIIPLLIYFPAQLSSPGAVPSDTLQGRIGKSLLAPDVPSRLSPRRQAALLLWGLRQIWAPRCPALALPQSPPGLLIETQTASLTTAAFLSFSWWRGTSLHLLSLLPEAEMCLWGCVEMCLRYSCLLPAWQTPPWGSSEALGWPAVEDVKCKALVEGVWLLVLSVSWAHFSRALLAPGKEEGSRWVCSQLCPNCCS